MKSQSAVIFSALLAMAGNASAKDEAYEPGSTTIPELLEPYVAGARPEMGDYRWMRGDFPNASEEEKKVSKAAMSYGAECYERHSENDVAGLRSMGIEPVEQSAYSIVWECSAFNRIAVPEGTTWGQFQEALAIVRPLVSGLVYGSDYALGSANDDDLSLPGKLTTRRIADQMTRSALVTSFRGTELFAGLDDLQLSIARDLLSQQMAKIDASNTKFLEELTASEGWPKASVVGEEAAHDVWLLVQHADAEPTLQLTALRQMEPLLKSKDVSAKDYAYLYDRIMLKIAGKQRYATQFECRGGERVPQALESDIASAERYRAAVGMETVAQNMERMDHTYGDCPLR